MELLVEPTIIGDDLSEKSAHLAEKKQKLIQFALSVLEDPRYKFQFQHLMHDFQLTREQVLDGFLRYNLDMFAFDNDIYDTLANRIVLHIHNLVKGSWHTDRQNMILEFLQELNPASVIDIGFGVPSKYVQYYLQHGSNIKITLCDLYDTAFKFAESLLNTWSANWENVVNLKRADMNEPEQIGKYQVYMFQDSIEHIPNSAECLSKYVELASEDAYFILSIPIGPKIAAHYIAWLSDQEAIGWLNQCGLQVIRQKQQFVNPSVDLFAEQLGADYHNILVVCKKLDSHVKQA